MISQLLKTTMELPPRIQAICWAQFWAWIGTYIPMHAHVGSNIDWTLLQAGFHSSSTVPRGLARRISGTRCQRARRSPKISWGKSGALAVCRLLSSRASRSSHPSSYHSAYNRQTTNDRDSPRDHHPAWPLSSRKSPRSGPTFKRPGGYRISSSPPPWSWLHSHAHGPSPQPLSLYAESHGPLVPGPPSPSWGWRSTNWPSTPPRTHATPA